MMKNASLTLILLILLNLHGEYVYTQNQFEKMTWCEFCIIAPFLYIDSIINRISASSTLSVNIKGVKAEFRKNTIAYNKTTGRIEIGVLLNSIETVMRQKKITIIPGEVRFHENGNIAKCDISYAELITGDNRTIKCAGFAEFYDDEVLKSTVIHSDSEKTDFTIQGKKRTVAGKVVFHHNGEIEEYMLNSNEIFRISDYPVAFEKGTIIRFSEKRNIIYIKVPYNKNIKLKLKGEFINAGDDILLSENGIIIACTLKRSHNILNGKHKVNAAGPISFYVNGMIKECSLPTPSALNVNRNNIIFEKDDGRQTSILRFYSNGNPEYGKISERITQKYKHISGNIKLKKGSLISFHENGGIKSLYPETGESIISGKNRMKVYEDKISFYQNGSIMSASVNGGENFYYKDHLIRCNSYACTVFFDKSGEITAFSSEASKGVTANGKEFTLPEHYVAGYDNYGESTISFVKIYYQHLALPQNISIKDVDEYTRIDIFVKAEKFLNDSDKKNVTADGIKEIMFSEDTILLIKGEEHLCKEMTWFKLPDAE